MTGHNTPHQAMTIDELPTPALLIERTRFEENLARMQELAGTESVDLRPHTKTHKSVHIAGRQRELGAQGLTVARVGEAEVFAAAGFSDIRIAYEVVGRNACERLAALQSRSRMSVCVDTPEGARALSDWFASAGRKIDVLVEVDTGHGRCGVAWDGGDAIDFVQLVRGLPGLSWHGLLTHAGHSYHGPRDSNETPSQALERHAAEERDRILSLASKLAEAGIAPDVVSIGSTPTMSRFKNVSGAGPRITEIRPGNYVFNDAIQVGLATTTLEHCALTVLATVISRHRDRGGAEHVYLDSGKKTLTSDEGKLTNGYGILLYNPRTMTPLPHAAVTGLSEEHAWVQVSGGSTLQVGDRIRFVPNHACVTVDTKDTIYMVDGDEVIEEISVDARGKSA